MADDGAVEFAPSTAVLILIECSGASVCEMPDMAEFKGRDDFGDRLGLYV